MASKRSRLTRFAEIELREVFKKGQYETRRLGLKVKVPVGEIAEAYINLNLKLEYINEIIKNRHELISKIASLKAKVDANVFATPEERITAKKQLKSCLETYNEWLDKIKKHQ